jgi:8-oxo-dGTP pyrophosphatase MutT (NUDIX family)
VQPPGAAGIIRPAMNRPLSHPPHWHCLLQARAHDPAARMPLLIGTRRVGSVARQHGDTLRAAQAGWLQVTAHEVVVDAGTPELDACWHALNEALHAQGLILGWRNEPYAVREHAGAEPLACIERAAARFWGTLTFGAHANGYVADAAGRPVSLWIARRALDKATDPGLHDNLIGGGVPAGQTPLQALVREAWEEAGLQPSQLGGLRGGRIVGLERDIREGLQREHLHSYDLALPAGLTPVNQDGEVMDLQCLPVQDALHLARSDRMTVDAALVTLDFALRHHLLAGDEAHVVAAAFASLLEPGTVADDSASFHAV